MGGVTRTVLIMAALAIFAGSAMAQDSTEDRLKQLEERILKQEQEIRKLKGDLAAANGGDSVEAELDQYLSKTEGGAWWDDPDSSRVNHGTGLNFSTSNGWFKAQIGGRIMADWVWHFDDDDKDEFDEITDFFEAKYFEDQFEFRRARIFMAGTLWENVEWKVQYDFASGSDVSFGDVWMGLKNVPWVGNVRVGNQFEPFGLENQSSSKYITFMERSMLTDAFTSGRSVGIRLHNDYYDGRLGWGLGYFTGDATTHNQEKTFAARVWGTPWQCDDTPGLLHIGVSFRYFDFENDTARFRFRPENHVFDRALDTRRDFGPDPETDGITDANDGATVLAIEAMFVYDRFSLQAEAMWASFDSDLADDPTLWGFYIYGSWFITGESRAYKKGLPSRIKVADPFHYDDGGPGAWELAIRYSYVDFEDGNLYDYSGMTMEELSSVYLDGQVSNWTIGLNWYLNRNTRIMFNYLISDIEGLEETLDALMVRFQVDF